MRGLNLQFDQHFPHVHMGQSVPLVLDPYRLCSLQLHWAPHVLAKPFVDSCEIVAEMQGKNALHGASQDSGVQKDSGVLPSQNSSESEPIAPQPPLISNLSTT